ncbi:MAG: Na/Pi cotransporter family protein [Eubacteriales bacterium]|nr:Na/Pi cotransporter family protein [Eubacteriales bacterium]
MDVLAFLPLLGGLAMFIYGMNLMGEGLNKMAGGRLEQTLANLTRNKWACVLLGAGITAAIQSSSGTSVMVVGLVNSGIMKMNEALGVIMGANVGTTVTAWIFSLAGLSSDNLFLKLLKPSSFAPILAFLSIFLIMSSKAQRKKDIGSTVFGFALLMIGMETMSSTMKPLTAIPSFQNLFIAFEHPLIGFLAGIALTVVIQSSSASIGILQALSATGHVSYRIAIPIILGLNIGTTVTALLSAIGTSRNAKRTAVAHLYIKILSAVIFALFFSFIQLFWDFPLDDTASFVGIAVIHTTVNLLATAVLIHFIPPLVKMAVLSVPGDEDESFVDEDLKALDPLFLNRPGFAMRQAKNVANQMAEFCIEALASSIDILIDYDAKKEAEIIRLEQKADRYEDKLGSYLVKLTERELSQKDSNTASNILYSISDFERISDHAVSIAYSAREMHEKKICFSAAAKEELAVYLGAVQEICHLTYNVFAEEDIELASEIEPLEERIDGMSDELKVRHVERLRYGACTIEMGFIFSDILTGLERVADHCSNIAAGIVEIQHHGLDTHQYLQEIKSGAYNFYERYQKYKKKYQLPPVSKSALTETAEDGFKQTPLENLGDVKAMAFQGSSEEE